VGSEVFVEDEDEDVDLVDEDEDVGSVGHEDLVTVVETTNQDVVASRRNAT